MAPVRIALLCNLLHVVLAIHGQQLQSNAVGSLKVHSNQRDDTSTALDSNQLDCVTIQPASFLQKMLHPWTGDYETTQKCMEVPVLHNTGDRATCSHISLGITIWIFLLIPVGACIFFGISPWALPVLLIPLVISWGYLLSTGLFADFNAGAMVVTKYSTMHPKFHNCSAECFYAVTKTLHFTAVMAVVVIYTTVMACYFSGPMFLSTRMKVERQATRPLLEQADREFIDSSEFRTKCVKAFREADADHNGTLDMSELQHVVLFDLTDEEKKYVQESTLFKEAFEKCDADGSHSIDQEEFVEVMKFIMTKAKFAASRSTGQEELVEAKDDSPA